MSNFEQHLRATVGSLHTVEGYLSDVRSFESFSNGRGASVTVLEEWVASLNHGRNRPQTVQRKLAAIRRYLAWKRVHLQDQEAALTLDILRDYKVSPAVRQMDRKEVRPLEVEEFSRLLEAVHQEATKSLLSLLWWSGARISEALGDPKAGIPALTILDGILLLQGRTATRGKGGKRRAILLPVAGREALREYVERRIAPLWYRGDVGLLEPLFVTRTGRLLTKQGVNSILHRAESKARVRRTGIHALRHSFKARLRQAGVEPEIIRRLLGHGPNGVTEMYGRAEVEELQTAIDRLN